jgi:hypothetical protein
VAMNRWPEIFSVMVKKFQRQLEAKHLEGNG